MSSRGRQLVKTIFNTDNKVMKVCERIFDFICLNLIFLLSCLPIITIGTARISLYYVLNQMKRTQHVSILKEYFYSFRLNFKIGFSLFLIELAVVGIIGLDLYLIHAQTIFTFTAMKAICIGLLFLVSLFALIIYPLVSSKEYQLKALLKITLLQLSFNIFKSFLLLLIFIALIFVYFSSVFTLVFGSLFLLIAGFSTLASIQLTIIDKMITPKLDEIL